jgi:hypothetical protein
MEDRATETYKKFVADIKDIVKGTEKTTSSE